MAPEKLNMQKKNFFDYIFCCIKILSALPLGYKKWQCILIRYLVHREAAGLPRPGHRPKVPVAGQDEAAELRHGMRVPRAHLRRLGHEHSHAEA